MDTILAPNKVKVKCEKKFKLETLFGGETGIPVEKGQKGEGLQYILEDGKTFYELEMGGYMFSMKEDSFNEHMTIMKKR